MPPYLVDNSLCELAMSLHCHKYYCWLVVLTILKKISQWEELSHILIMENTTCSKPPTSIVYYSEVIYCGLHKCGWADLQRGSTGWM